MVAGGYNSKDRVLQSVEFMDLGENLSNIQFNQIMWRNLPEMKQRRSNALILVNDRYLIIKFHNYLIIFWQELCSCSGWGSGGQKLS